MFDDEETFHKAYDFLETDADYFTAKSKTDGSDHIVKRKVFPTLESANDFYVFIWKINSLKLENILPIKKIYIESVKGKNNLYIVTPKFVHYFDKKPTEDTYYDSIYGIFHSVITLHEKGYIFPTEGLLPQNVYVTPDGKTVIDLLISEGEPKSDKWWPKDGKTASGNLFSMGWLFTAMMFFERDYTKISWDAQFRDLLTKELIQSMVEAEPEKRVLPKDIEGKLARIRNRSKGRKSIFGSFKGIPKKKEEDVVDKDEEHTFHRKLSMSMGAPPQIQEIISKIGTNDEKHERDSLEKQDLIMQGTLSKNETGVFSGWRSRYFYLTSTFLYYEKDKKLAGKIALKDASVTPDEKRIGFKIAKSGKEVLFSCKTKEEKTEWLDAFKKASQVKGEKKCFKNGLILYQFFYLFDKFPKFLDISRIQCKFKIHAFAFFVMVN
jgi:hypothetical protein